MDGHAHLLERVIFAMSQDLFLQMSELAFDAVEPPLVGWEELKKDIVLLGPTEALLGFAGRKVVQDGPKPTAAFATHGLEKRQELPGALAPFEAAPQLPGAPPPPAGANPFVIK